MSVRWRTDIAANPLPGDENLRAQHGAAGEASTPIDGGRSAARVEGARYPAEQRGHAAAVDRGSGVLHRRQQEAKRSTRTDAEITARNRVDGAVLVAVEEELDDVLLAHPQRGLDQHAARALVELDQAPVLHRVVQAH